MDTELVIYDAFSEVIETCSPPDPTAVRAIGVSTVNRVAGFPPA